MVSMRFVWSGGTVGGLIASPNIAGHETLFAGTEVGVLVSTDLGRTWHQTSVDAIAYVESMALSPMPGDLHRLLAGGPTGLHWSDDDGVSWQRQFAAHVHALTTFAGRRGEVIVVAGTERDGVLRSLDGGTTWASANPGLLDPTVLTLAVSPLRAGARTLFAGTTSGVSISRNEGQAWRPGLVPDDEPVVQCLAISPRWAEDRRAFAGTESSGLLRTDDGGLTWQAVPAFAGQGVGAIAWAADREAGSRLVVASGRDLLCSADDGQTWQLIGTTPSEIAMLWLRIEREAPILLVGQFERGLTLWEHQ